MKKKIYKTFCLVMVFTLLSSFQAFCYPQNATMNYSNGFPSGYSTGIRMKYYQYGTMNWSSYVNDAVSKINSCPANISLSNQSYYTYNQLQIAVSSNYWEGGDWWGVAGECEQITNDLYAQKKVYLNSSYSTNMPNAVALHEFLHAFGINDCENVYSIAHGYALKYNYITSDVNSLLINRYGRR